MTASKADYVRRQPQIRKHTCHWPGCTKQVPPAMWGCKKHWFALPFCLRQEIWAAYRIERILDMSQSKEYLEVAERVQNWIRLRIK